MRRQRQYMYGGEILAHIAGRPEPIDWHELSDPKIEAAWWECIDAAADGALRIEQLDANYEPHPWPTGYAIRQMMTRDLYPLTDLCRLRALGAEVENVRLRADGAPPSTNKPEQAALNRALLDLAQARGRKIKQGDDAASAMLDELGASHRQKTKAFRSLPEQYRYVKGKPGK